jgi:hypothetical protein
MENAMFGRFVLFIVSIPPVPPLGSCVKVHLLYTLNHLFSCSHLSNKQLIIQPNFRYTS